MSSFVPVPDRPRAPRPRRAMQQGSVLVAVLAMILILSTLVTRFIDEAVEDLEYRALFTPDATFRSYAYSLMETTLAVLSEIAEIDGGKLHAPEQGWSDPLQYADIPLPGGWEASVQIQDESGRFPLNQMDEATLNLLFEELDFGFSTSRELSSALLDWIDADESARLNGAESDTYLDEDPPYRAADGPIQSFDELRLIEGFEEAFFDADTGEANAAYFDFIDSVSLINDGPVNLNSAPPLVTQVLALLGGFDEERIFDNALDTPYLTELPDSVDTSLATTEAGILSIRLTLSRGNIPFTLYALVKPNFATDSGSGSGVGRVSGSGGGRAADSDQTRTGSEDEQAALNYPFTIIRLSEHRGDLEIITPARYSAVDIPGRTSDD